MRTCVTTLIIMAILATTGVAVERKIFEITIEELTASPGGYLFFPGDSGILYCHVDFHGKPPPPATVDRIVRFTLESAILVNASRDIVAEASFDDAYISEEKYSGKLVYWAADKRILTWDESQGVKSSSHDTGVYYVETQEHGLNPKVMGLTLVFPEAPQIQQAYDAAVVEAEKAALKGLDVHVYVSVGDKSIRKSWRALPDPGGDRIRHVTVDYIAATKTIVRPGTGLDHKVFKKLP
jgi:hypothetical protein